MFLSLAKASGINLIYTLAVIVFGGLVRATNSGAGCGNHWPLCNSSIMPSAVFSTIVEYSHRIMSLILIITVIWLAIWSYRKYQHDKNHPARLLSVLVLLFVLFETAIGALLVMFGLVADNVSYFRSYVMGMHLINTFFLLALQYIHFFSVSEYSCNAADGFFKKLYRSFTKDYLFACSLFAVLIACATGAMVALGDTLILKSLAGEYYVNDHNKSLELLIALRIWHPLIAVLSCLLCCVYAARIITTSQKKQHKSFNIFNLASVFWNKKSAAFVLVVIVIMQLIVGVVNWLLMVPVTIQLLHLLLASLLWLSLIKTKLSVIYNA